VTTLPEQPVNRKHQRNGATRGQLPGVWHGSSGNLYVAKGDFLIRKIPRLPSRPSDGRHRRHQRRLSAPRQPWASFARLRCRRQPLAAEYVTTHSKITPRQRHDGSRNAILRRSEDVPAARHLIHRRWLSTATASFHPVQKQHHPVANPGSRCRYDRRSSGPTGVLRQLDTSPRTATSWSWEIVRQLEGSARRFRDVDSEIRR